jgi:hypothetical protein
MDLAENAERFALEGMGTSDDCNLSGKILDVGSV